MREPLVLPVGEPTRRLVVRLAFLFYLLLLAEGPLRKWVLPSASNALVFLRDPVMVALLVAGARLRVGTVGKRGWRLFGAVLLVALACVTGQLATADAPPLALLAGLRNYLLFAPLGFLVGEAFGPDDYARWLRLNLWLAAPVALLVVVQYRAPPTAFINAAPGGDSEGVFLLVADVVRPYGLFSFTLGHSVFAAWMIGVALAGATAPRRLGIGAPLAAVGGLAAIAMVAFSGSRTALLLAAAVMVAFVTGSVFGCDAAARRRALAATAILLGAALATAALVPDLASNLIERQEAAVANEGDTDGRIGQVLTEFAGQLDAVPPLGFGLGAGTNVAAFLSNGRTDRVLAEYELTRMVQELGPFVGLAAIGLRWALAFGLACATLRAARRGNLQPACFLGLVAPLLLVHDVTLQNSMIGIAWFATGILVATLRLDAGFDRTPFRSSRQAAPHAPEPLRQRHVPLPRLRALLRRGRRAQPLPCRPAAQP